MGCGELTALDDVRLYLDENKSQFLLSESNQTFVMKSEQEVIFSLQEYFICEHKTQEKLCELTLKNDYSTDAAKKYFIVTPEFIWITPNTPMTFNIESNVDWFIEIKYM